MTKIANAVYSQGVLKPDQNLGLREGQGVRLIVETINEHPEDRSAALARLKAGIANMNFFLRDPFPPVRSSTIAATDSLNASRLRRPVLSMDRQEAAQSAGMKRSALRPRDSMCNRPTAAD